MSGFLSNMFNGKPDQPVPQQRAQVEAAIDKTFQPSKGTFFRTREYPEINEKLEVTGKVWLEAGYDEQTKNWVLWQKTIRKTNDVLQGGTTVLMNNNVLFEKTDFVAAYDQMTTFEMAQKSMNVEPMKNKSISKLGGDYYKQFAWREGLMMSRAGGLYPFKEESVKGATQFHEQDITDALVFLNRLKTEQFVSVPISFPSGNWDKRYQDKKTRTDERLNALYARYNNENGNHDLAVQIVGQEPVEVLWAHMQRGFEPKVFEADTAKHYALIKAAVDRPEVDSLGLLSEAGVSFQISYKGDTPVEQAIQQRRYSHLYAMLSRDGATLANQRDDTGQPPAYMAMTMQDRQSFRMLYLEGLDYTYVDNDGCSIIHRAFESGFIPGVYAWLDEGLSIDEPIRNTQFTGLSIARFKGEQTLVDFALAHGANKDAADMKARADAINAPQAAEKPQVEFAADLLNSSMTNQDIEAAAKTHVASGKSLNLLSDKGVSVLELCWKNQKSNADQNRRNLLPVLGKLGADPAAQLADGTTVLTRVTSGTASDFVDFLKALAPITKDANNADAAGNNLLHTLQMNANESIAHSNNVATILKLFPGLDLNRQNNEGFSNIGLAVRLNRSQTIKNLPATIQADWSQTTAGGWSMLDMAFTSAAAMQSVTGAPRADKIAITSEPLKNAVLDMIDRTVKTGTDTQKKNLVECFARQRPDGKALAQVITAENLPPAMIARLKNSGMPSP